MQPDQRFAAPLQAENGQLRQEVVRMSGLIKALQEKYQKSLKEMSSIIHANQNLKQQLDNIKASAKLQIENSVQEAKVAFEKQLQNLVKQKNELHVANQNLTREKEQNQHDMDLMEKNLWEAENLKKELAATKKQHERLLLQSLPQNQENPEYKLIQQKLTQKIQELSAKNTELTVQNAINKKSNENAENECRKREKEIERLTLKCDELSTSLQKATIQVLVNETGSPSKLPKPNQTQLTTLRKRNAELTNELQRLRLEKLEVTSQNNKNEAEMQLLNTLRTLHSQLQPMRYEIEELKREKQLEHENTNKQKTELQMKLLSCEHERDTLKLYIKELESKNREASQQLREKQWERTKCEELEEEKRILEGRVIVYEAMEMVTKNRSKPQHIERIEEFERRIRLLLEEENLQYLVHNANVHQLIAMKAYVIELDNKLRVVGEHHEHLSKKYAAVKEKQQHLSVENKKIISRHQSMVGAYKGKLQGYEKLINKLTEELERHIQEHPGPTTPDIRSVVTVYEGKLLSIGNELNAWKHENSEMQKKLEAMQPQLRSKLDHICELEVQLSSSKKQNKELSVKLLTQQHEHVGKNGVKTDHYQTLLNDKTRQVADLQDQLSKLRGKLDKIGYDHERELEGYKHKINRLEVSIEQLRVDQSDMGRQFPNDRMHLQHSLSLSQFGELKQKVSLLESSLENRNKADGNQGYFKLLIDEINNLKRDVNKINLLLQNKIIDLETELAIKYNELNNYDLPAPTNVYMGPSAQSQRLKEENTRLKAELEKVRVNYRDITEQSEKLMAKIRDTQSYIMSLRDDFNAVSFKIGEYEKELSAKDNELYEQKLKFSSLQQQYEDQLRNLKSFKYESMQMEPKESYVYINQTDKMKPFKYEPMQMEPMQMEPKESQVYINQTNKMKPFKYELIQMDPKESQAYVTQTDKMKPFKYEPMQMEPKETQVHITQTDKMKPFKYEYMQIEPKENQMYINQMRPFKYDSIQLEPKESEPYLSQSANTKPFKYESIQMEPKESQAYLSQSDKMWQAEKRQMEHRQREMQRKQIEINQKESEIEHRNRELAERLRKFEERQLNAVDEQGKRGWWFGQLQRKESKEMNSSPYSNYLQQKNGDRQLVLELQQKLQKLQLQRREAEKSMETKDERVERLTREKAELSRQVEDLSFDFTGKAREQEHNQRQIVNLKEEIEKLEGEMEKLWREHDVAKQQLRTKQRELDDAHSDKSHLQRRHEIEVRQLNMAINEKDIQIENLESIQKQPKKSVDYPKIEREWEQRIQEIEQRNHQRLKQLHNVNEENVRELQQTISALQTELSKVRMSASTEMRREQDANSSTIASLKSQISNLERDIQRRQFNSDHLEEEVKYYKGLVDRRDQEILKLHETTFSATITQPDNPRRMMTEINELEGMLQEREDSRHEECAKKEHMLRMEIQRLSNILESKVSIKEEREEQEDAAESGYPFGNSYLNELEQANKQLEEDLAGERKRLLVSFEMQRNIDEYLAILVDALRVRVRELEDNFRGEQERQLTVLKKLDNLQQHGFDVNKILGILKELQVSHQAFHLEEERSKNAFLKKINNQVLGPGNQPAYPYRDTPGSYNERSSKSSAMDDSPRPIPYIPFETLNIQQNTFLESSQHRRPEALARINKTETTSVNIQYDPLAEGSAGLQEEEYHDPGNDGYE